MCHFYFGMITNSMQYVPVDDPESSDANPELGTSEMNRIIIRP